MKSQNQIFISILICALLPACSSRTGDKGHSFRIIQGNGIVIAETSGGPKYADPLFTLEEILVLQQDPGNEDSLLYGPGMFLRSEDGRYYVSDSRAKRIAVYDETGSFLFDFGQQGYGPGDFAGLSWLNFVNGELHAYDGRVERVSRFSPEGHLIGVVSSPYYVEPVQGYLFRMHLTSEGLPVVIAQQDDYRPDAQWVRHLGYLYSAQGDTLSGVQSDWVRRSKIIPVGDDQFTTLFIPYGPSSQVCYSPVHGFVSGTGHTPELECMTLDGQRSWIRFEEEHRLITAEERSRTRARYDQRIAEAEGARKTILQAEKDALEWPEHRPFWRRFELDDQGFIWLDVYETLQEMEDAGGGSLYRILSPEGEYLGRVRIPSHSGAKGFSRGYLTIIRTDRETGEYLPTVYRMRPVKGLKYPNLNNIRRVSPADSIRNQDPLSTVEKFLKLDYEGARLSADSYASVDSLVVWDENGWDMSVVVGGYKITGIYSSNDSFHVQVDYDVLGITGGLNWIAADSSYFTPSEWERDCSVTFLVTSHPSGWRISGEVIPDTTGHLISTRAIPPHVAPEIELRHLEELMSEGHIRGEGDLRRYSFIVGELKKIVEERASRSIPPRQ